MNELKKSKLIVLSGTSNSGKTNSLKLLISHIISTYNVNKNQYLSTTNYNTAKSWKHKTIRDMINDSGDWLVFLNDIKGKSIAIHTAGDTRLHVEHSLTYIGKYDIVICATKATKHTSTGSVGTMQSFLRNNSQLIYFPFYKLQYDSDTDADKIFDDNRVSQLILGAIEQII